MLALYDDVYGSQKGENIYQKKKGESRQREHALPVGVSNQLCIDRSLSHNNQVALELSPLGLLVAKSSHANFKFSLGVLLTNFPAIFDNPTLIGCINVHCILSFLFVFLNWSTRGVLSGLYINREGNRKYLQNKKSTHIGGYKLRPRKIVQK